MPALGGIRGRHLFVVDLVVIALAIVGAMVLRFDSFGFAEEALIYFPAALFPLIVRPPINILGGLYARAWAYASVGELARIALVVPPARSSASSSSTGSSCRSGSRARHAARPFPAVVLRARGPADARRHGRCPVPRPRLDRVEGLATGRPRSPASRGKAVPTGPVPTLVYGAGDVGATVIRTIAAARDGLGMRVVGLLDDDPRKRNQILRGQKVLGTLGRAGEHRPRDRRSAAAHRDPVGLGRHRPQGGPRTRRPRPGDADGARARRPRVRPARRGGDPRGPGRRPAAARARRHRRDRVCATSCAVETVLW